jgi:lipoprotein-anchoring transpeptidase ErfK/SrfK
MNGCMMWDKFERMRVALLATACVFACGSVALAEIKPQDFEVLGGMGGSDHQPLHSAPNDTGPGDGAGARTDLSIDTVAWSRNLPPGSILVKTGERKLYLSLGNGRALRYPVGVGRDGFSWSGRNRISRKAEWPQWRPPQVMIEREAKKGHFLPDMMEGGPKNPLGARALYIGSTQFRIHGTTQPWSIGHAVSSGCIRMLNEHVIDLYDRVSTGAVVMVER